MAEIETPHKCAKCAALDMDDAHTDRYGGDTFVWCAACGCYVWIKGTCVERSKA